MLAAQNLIGREPLDDAKDKGEDGMVAEFTRTRAELQAIQVVEGREGWPVTWAGPIQRSRFDQGKYERTVEGILAGACYSLPPAAAN